MKKMLQHGRKKVVRYDEGAKLYSMGYTFQDLVTKRSKKRNSVIKKLHDKSIAIAKRYGKPLPRYLEQKMAQERRRK